VSSHSVKTSSDRQIIAFFEEIGVAESNGDVGEFIRSSEIAVCAHAQYKFGQKTAKNDWRYVVRPSRLQVTNTFAIATFYCHVF